MLLVGTIICLVKLVDLLPQYTKDAQSLTDRPLKGMLIALQFSNKAAQGRFEP